jgi:hypothetical protein
MITFLCGHSSEEPRNMGRGASRQSRLAAYAARPCLYCAIKNIVFHWQPHTDVHGRPLPPAEQIAKQRAAIAHITALY